MRVILYGIGQRYHDLFDNYDNDNLVIGLWGREIEIVGLADSNPDAWGKTVTYNGLRFKVNNIQEISADAFEKILVVSKNYFSEISSMLCQNGYKQEQILLIDDLCEDRFERINYVSNEYLGKQWDMLDQAGGSISSFLKLEKYQKIAVYGTGILARRLIGVLKQSDLNLHYVIDMNRLPDADIIVAAEENEDYMDIERRLCEKNNVEIISIQELIYRVLKNLKEE